MPDYWDHVLSDNFRDFERLADDLAQEPKDGEPIVLFIEPRYTCTQTSWIFHAMTTRRLRSRGGKHFFPKRTGARFLIQMAKESRRAAVMQVILGLAASVRGGGAWFMGARRAWLVGAVVIFAVVPFTFIAIMPTNKKLLDPALDRSSVAVHLLLVHWGRLHGVQSFLSLTASVIFLAAAVWR